MVDIAKPCGHSDGEVNLRKLHEACVDMQETLNKEFTTYVEQERAAGNVQQADIPGMLALFQLSELSVTDSLVDLVRMLYYVQLKQKGGGLIMVQQNSEKTVKIVWLYGWMARVDPEGWLYGIWMDGKGGSRRRTRVYIYV